MHTCRKLSPPTWIQLIHAWFIRHRTTFLANPWGFLNLQWRGSRTTWKFSLTIKGLDCRIVIRCFYSPIPNQKTKVFILASYKVVQVLSVEAQQLHLIVSQKFPFLERMSTIEFSDKPPQNPWFYVLAVIIIVLIALLAYLIVKVMKQRVCDSPNIKQIL